MQKLNFPEASFRMKTQSDQTRIFDPLRKRFVLLTPEEWVRQHLINYLIIHKNVPAALLASERGLIVNGMKKRFDVLVFSTSGSPLLIAECKAPGIKLSDETIYQAVQYNLSLKASYLLVTNGMDHYIARIDYNTAGLNFLDAIPDYREMLTDKI